MEFLSKEEFDRLKATALLANDEYSLELIYRYERLQDMLENGATLDRYDGLTLSFAVLDFSDGALSPIAYYTNNWAFFPTCVVDGAKNEGLDDHHKKLKVRKVGKGGRFDTYVCTVLFRNGVQYFKELHISYNQAVGFHVHNFYPYATKVKNLKQLDVKYYGLYDMSASEFYELISNREDHGQVRLLQTLYDSITDYEAFNLTYQIFSGGSPTFHSMDVGIIEVLPLMQFESFQGLAGKILKALYNYTYNNTREHTQDTNFYLVLDLYTVENIERAFTEWCGITRLCVAIRTEGQESDQTKRVLGEIESIKACNFSFDYLSGYNRSPTDMIKIDLNESIENGVEYSISLLDSILKESREELRRQEELFNQGE